jgi:dihydroorotase
MDQAIGGLGNALDLHAAKQTPYAYDGFNVEKGGWVLPGIFNAHDHLRCPKNQPALFRLAVVHSALSYDLSTAMPNLGVHRIREPEQAIEYRAKCVEEGRSVNPNYSVTVPLYLEMDTDPDVVKAGFTQAAWMSAKLYPQHGTTGSAEGVDFRRIHELLPVFQMMEGLGMLLLVHGEAVLDENGHLIPDRFRENRAIHVIAKILQACPKLRIVFEHISSKEAVLAVIRWQKQGYKIEATIAPQYLLWNSTKLFAGGMNPVFFSIPMLKDEHDRMALIHFMVNGGGFFGTDCAPHDKKAKSKHVGCPGGVFNNAIALFVYFHIFRLYGGEEWFEKFLQFACYKAREFYGFDFALPNPARPRVLITEEPWGVPAVYSNAEAEVVPMFAGMTMPYSSRRI